MDRPITLLWSLRSPCPLGCRYCYFGTIEEHRVAAPTRVGQLSHLSRTDLTGAQVFAFAATLEGSAVGRVFLAGGEPLVWPPVLDLVRVLKDVGTQVVVCTNGIPLNRGHVTDQLLALDVDAVSVSLDSTDPTYNDIWRPARNGREGWPQVVSGIETLLRARGDRASPRVGIYSVITRLNIPQVLQMGNLAAELGCDYYVPQPVALGTDHTLHDELSLRPGDTGDLASGFADLYHAGLLLTLPDGSFPARVTASIASSTGVVSQCFGGHTLFFIQPDGSVWDCPSALKIAATPAHRRRTIRDGSAGDLFGPPQGCPADCALFSRDCVNMWPLMDFTRILDPSSAGP